MCRSVARALSGTARIGYPNLVGGRRFHDGTSDEQVSLDSWPHRDLPSPRRGSAERRVCWSAWASASRSIFVWNCGTAKLHPLALSGHRSVALDPGSKRATTSRGRATACDRSSLHLAVLVQRSKFGERFAAAGVSSSGKSAMRVATRCQFLACVPQSCRTQTVTI